MRRDTLLDFFADLSHARGDFLVYDNGFRTHAYTYRDTVRAARAFAARLTRAGLTKGDAVLVWSENRPEWIVALWGCLLQGIVSVPIDYRASPDFLRRVATIVKARVLVAGSEVPLDGVRDAAAMVWPLDDLDWSDTSTIPDASVTRDDVAEIIFTSGATAEPKGVVITHRNLLANIVPVEREILKYRKYAWPFSPIRFLNLLPLSHMFGQSMATFVPPMLAGTVVFIHGYNPNEIVRQITQRRISVLVSVPKILDVLREHILRLVPEASIPPPQKEHFTRRWWRYRRVHRTFGLKFWSFVVGAAPLDPALEEFWGRLGFAVVQGYGLTETAPIVSLNHPFSTSRGSVGKAIAGVEVKVADDGEILVRGDNVTSGYFNADAATREAFEDGWFHTGDIGELDANGRLFIRGRKKEMIVTSEGLNVFPEDVERAVNAVPGVRDSAVIGLTQGSDERVHAVIVADDTVDLDAVVRNANSHLLDHQKVKSVSRWPGAELPRTDGTRKLKRREIRDWASGGSTPVKARSGDTVEGLLSRFTAGRTISNASTLDELGLSSLERVELMVALEERFHTTIDESTFAAAKNVADLERMVREGGPGPRGDDGPAGPVDFPAWNRSWPVRWLRRVSQTIWLLPLARVFARIRVEGREHIEHLTGPVVYAANHQSHMDTPVILSALGGRIRAHVAVAMAKEFFEAHFFPERVSRWQWFTNSLNYYLAATFFNAFPLPQREAGTRQTLRYIGSLLAEGESVLIFPEGRRSEDDQVLPFRPGIGMVGARLDVPIVPVRIEGVNRVLHSRARMATPGRVTVRFGEPLELSGDDYSALASQVEEAVRRLGGGR